MATRFIIITGTAGSGKSSLAGSLSSYIESHGGSVVRVNLDPAAEKLPYEPEVDSRSYVSVERFLSEGLGPNGALIAAVDSLVDHLFDIRDEIESYKADYAVVDTPGQLELFAYRMGGPFVVNALIGDNPAVNVFLVDSVFMESAGSIVSALMLASSVALRLGVPQINVVSKADLLLPEVREEVVPRLGEPGFLGYLLERDMTVKGWRRLLLEQMAAALESSGFVGEVLPVSSIEVETLSTLFAKIQQITAMGDDYRIYDLRTD